MTPAITMTKIDKEELLGIQEPNWNSWNIQPGDTNSEAQRSEISTST